MARSIRKDVETMRKFRYALPLGILLCLLFCAAAQATVSDSQHGITITMTTVTCRAGHTFDPSDYSYVRMNGEGTASVDELIIPVEFHAECTHKAHNSEEFGCFWSSSGRFKFTSSGRKSCTEAFNSSTIFRNGNWSVTFVVTKAAGGNHLEIVDIPAVPATCTSTGLTKGTRCSVCNTVIQAQQVTLPLAHQWVNFTPNAIVPGEAPTHMCTCKVCDTKKSFPCAASNTPNCHQGYICNLCKREWGVDAANHDGDTEVRDDFPPTCYTLGYSGNLYCKGCGAKLRGGSDLPYNPDNHAGGTELRGDYPATCAKEGYTGDTYCLGCKERLNSGTAIPKPPHVYEAVVTAPRCHEKGCTTYTCKNCSSSFVTDITNALAHYYSLWEYAEKDTHTAVCLRKCGHSATRECTPLTILLDGETLTVCPVCGWMGDTAMTVIEKAHAEAAGKNELPARGELIVRHAQPEAAGVVGLLSIAFEYNGYVEPLPGEARVSVPLALPDGFLVMRTNDAGKMEIVPHTYADGVLTIQIASAGLFLIVK